LDYTKITNNALASIDDDAERRFWLWFYAKTDQQIYEILRNTEFKINLTGNRMELNGWDPNQKVNASEFNNGIYRMVSEPTASSRRNK